MFIVSLVIIAVSVIIDQVIKLAVNSKIDPSQIVEVIKIGGTKIFSLTHVRNPGAAWSIMSGKTWFLVVFPILVCAAALIYIYKNRKGSRAELIGLSLIVGGGVGNLIDRVRLKEVIDYIMFEPVDFPIFNFADICVTIGTAVFAIAIVAGDIAKDRKAAAENG